MTQAHDDDHLDILINQVGRLTEGLTEIKSLVERVALTTEQQAEVARQQAAIAEKQAASVERLTQIVENLLQRSL